MSGAPDEPALQHLPSPAYDSAGAAAGAGVGALRHKELSHTELLAGGGQGSGHTWRVRPEALLRSDAALQSYSPPSPEVGRGGFGVVVVCLRAL